MTIDPLAKNCPRFTRVVLHVSASPAQAFQCADPGDAVVLSEHAEGVPTGVQITALVLERVPSCQPVGARK